MPYKRYKEMLVWLEENVQPNYHSNRDQFASSSVSQFIEWRSVDKESWVGKNNTAHPYTNLEGEMLKHAYKIAGIEWDDALKPNPTQKSMENPDIKKTSISPVVPFKGYK